MLCPQDHLTGIAQCYCDVSTGLRICHYAELSKIIVTTMPVNQYDDRKVSLRRPHGNSDLDIIQASYTRRIRKANVSEALHPSRQIFSYVGTDLPGLNQY